MSQLKPQYASKPPQASGPFSVELVRGSAGFGLTLSGGRDAAKDAPLAVRGLLKDGPAQRSGRLQVSLPSSWGGVLPTRPSCDTPGLVHPQAGDLVLQVNGESTQGLSQAQVVQRIRSGGPRLHLVLSRPLESHPSKPERGGAPQKGDGGFPRGEGSVKERRASQNREPGYLLGEKGLVVSVGKVGSLVPVRGGVMASSKVGVWWGGPQDEKVLRCGGGGEKEGVWVESRCSVRSVALAGEG